MYKCLKYIFLIIQFNATELHKHFGRGMTSNLS